MRVPWRRGWNALRAGSASNGRASRSWKSKPARRAVHVAGEPGGDLRQQIVHPGVDHRDPDAGGCGRAPGRGGHRRVQRLGAHDPLQVASQVLDRARHPVLVVRQPPARHHVASAVRHRQEHRAAPGPDRLGVARHDPVQGAVRFDAVDPDPGAVGEHQRVAGAERTVADAQRTSRQLHRPAQGEGERGGRGIVGAAHRSDHGAHPIPGYREAGVRLRRARETGAEERRRDQHAGPAGGPGRGRQSPRHLPLTPRPAASRGETAPGGNRRRRPSRRQAERTSAPPAFRSRHGRCEAKVGPHS